MDAPPAVLDYVAGLAAVVLDVLGPDLLGVYATGSAALGAFDPATSDIDVVAVCGDDLDREGRVLAGEVVRRQLLCCPARGLEFVLYPEATARRAGGDP